MIPIIPVGYKMLVRQVVQEMKTESGILLASSIDEQKRQQAGFPIYEVLAQGDACYQSRNGEAFPEGKWCDVGDIVLMDGYAGKSFSPKEFYSFATDDEELLAELKDMEKQGLKFHLVNDDMIMGVYKCQSRN